MITTTDHDDKANRIVDAAQRRFGLYGLEKTSMREIAEDLNLTKGSLYYYFPDKENLYLAVVEREQGQFIQFVNAMVTGISQPDELLMKYVEVRIHYFRSLLNLSRLRADAYKGLRPVFQGTWMSFYEQEVGLISKILTKGQEQGQFIIDEVENTSRLYLDLLRGLRQSLLSRKDLMLISEEEYEALVQKSKSFTGLFIRGLKYGK